MGERNIEGVRNIEGEPKNLDWVRRGATFRTGNEWERERNYIVTVERGALGKERTEFEVAACF